MEFVNIRIQVIVLQKVYYQFHFSSILISNGNIISRILLFTINVVY